MPSQLKAVVGPLPLGHQHELFRRGQTFSILLRRWRRGRPLSSKVGDIAGFNRMPFVPWSSDATKSKILSRFHGKGLERGPAGFQTQKRTSAGVYFLPNDFMLFWFWFPNDSVFFVASLLTNLVTRRTKKKAT